ncbi:adhesion G-protein coupled receptor F3 [Sceloporus undulatus]|uniref:adhesion G-protein coupled receptor F3 n=1 Tax=Sceloporus undulatus TaxID=8520 RepID=UPI001C4B914C|nr:adhesion G-protein coupled receptor F3 [Sceloporus undulatus]
MMGVREPPLGRLALVVQVLAIGSASGLTLASGATVLEGATSGTGLGGSPSEGMDSCGPPNRSRRAAAGPPLRATVYLKMAPVAPATLDATRTQQFLLAVSLPRDVNGASATAISALAVTTRCDPLQRSSRSCRCLPGYQWGSSHCKQLPACGGLIGAVVSLVTTCDCLSFPAGKTGYCLPPLQASPASKTSTLPPRLAPQEGSLSLSFQVGEGATDVELYLLRPEWNGGAKEVRNGMAVALALNGSEVALRVSSLSPDWAGTYICRYRHGEALWELRQEVSVPLVTADFLPGLSQVSMDCNSHRPLTLQCCVQDRGGGGGGLLRAAWDPGAPAFVVPVGGKGASLCHRLSLTSCPTKETPYRCTFEGEGLGSIQTTIRVTPIQGRDLFCPTEEEAGGSWGPTKAGRVAELLCLEGREGKRLRSCSSGGTWGPIQDNCTSRQLRSELHQAQLLQAGLGDPQTAIPMMLATLDGTLATAEETSPWDLLTAIAIMEVLSQVALESQLRLESSAVANFLSAANGMLSLDTESDWSRVETLNPRAASGFLQAIENLTSLLVLSLGGFKLSLPNLELQSSQLGPDSVDDDYLKTFDTEPEVSLHITEEELQALVRREGSITITSLVLKKMGGILPWSHSGATFSLGSLVMSNAIMSRKGSITEVVVDMMFGRQNATNKTEGYVEGGEEQVAQCVFWNHSLLEGMGGWSTEGCWASGTKMGTNCTCHHLTSFSVLMSAGPVPTSLALTVLSNLGISASILALVATLLIYYLVWSLVVKNKVSYFRYITLVNIALSLLLASFWFLATFQLTASHENKLCVAAAFFTHFFYLATFFWMLVQALMLFHQLIFVFHQLTMSSVTPAMVAVGYLCPLGIAAATVGATFPKRSYIQETLCWLSSQSKAIYAFSIPVLVIVLVNLLILFVVLMKLMRPSVSEGSPGEERQALLGIFKALLVLTPVFGLTWGLGVITMTSQASQFAHYAFTILNSFQGVFILIFGCLMDRKGEEVVRG